MVRHTKLRGGAEEVWIERGGVSDSDWRPLIGRLAISSRSYVGTLGKTSLAIQRLALFPLSAARVNS